MIKKLLILLCLAGVSAGTAFAQAPTADGTSAYNGLPNRFQVDSGLFRVSANTVLTATKGTGESGEVDFEEDLGLEPNAYTFWVDGTWRISRRQRLKLAYTKLNRETDGKKLGKTFVWNGQTYSAGLEASATLGTDTLSGYYRFAIVQNDRFELGPAIGIGWLSLSAGIKATGTFIGPGGSQSANLNESASMGQVTGDVGAYFAGWLAKRAVLRGDLLYIIVKPGDSEAAVTDGRLALDTYPWRHVGIGVQYKYNKFRYDRGIRDSGLGGALTFQGFQIYGSFLF